MTEDELRRHFYDASCAPERRRDRDRSMARELQRLLAPFAQQRARSEMFATIEVIEDGTTRTRLPPEWAILAREIDEQIEQIRNQFAKAAGLDVDEPAPTR